MSWRTVVISSSAKLDYQMGYLVVRRNDTIRIHISEIRILIVESTAVSLTNALLSELVKKKIKVIFCDEKRNPFSELTPYYGAHDCSMKIRQQINWTDGVKKEVWTEIVTEKIRKQKEVLEKYNKKECLLLEKYLAEIEFADGTNRERHAAKVYFNALWGKDFSRAQDNSINAALNYGYSIILSAFNREVTASGYLTQLGLFHDNMFNPFNLSSDLMEPFRPLIDKKVLDMRPQVFEHDEKMKMVDIINQEVKINGKSELVGNAVKIYCHSVFDAIEDQDVSLIKFYSDEL